MDEEANPSLGILKEDEKDLFLQEPQVIFHNFLSVWTQEISLTFTFPGFSGSLDKPNNVCGISAV